MKILHLTTLRKLIIMALTAFVFTAAKARQDTSRYALVLNFYSIGTGTPGDQPLKDFITNYRKQNKLKPLAATRVGGLGREGEYAIVFPLKELTEKQKRQFVTSLSKALPNLKNKGEAGGINLNENQPFDMNQSRVKPEMVTL